MSYSAKEPENAELPTTVQMGFVGGFVDGLGLGFLWRFLADWRDWFFKDGYDGGM